MRPSGGFIVISKIVIASMLAASSVSGSSPAAAQTVDGAKAYWPHMHQCTLGPVSNFTVTKTGGMSTGRSSMAGEYVRRIDLQVTGSPGGSPTITAHAINTKGTGANSGRPSAALRDRSPIVVACVTSQLTGDPAAQKVSISSFNYMGRNTRGVGWSCSVSGGEDKPVFSVGLLVPTILGQAERVVFAANVATAHSSVSIVPRGAAARGSESFACASKAPRKANYDLVMMTKA